MYINLMNYYQKNLYVRNIQINYVMDFVRNAINGFVSSALKSIFQKIILYIYPSLK